MGRGSAARGQKEGALRRGAWTAEEDQKLVAFIEKNKGHGSWRTLPHLAGLHRCGKSCRLRWINYLRPDIKRGNFSPEEERIITQLHALMGNKWSAIAARMPGRTDNEVKNHWNTHLKKRLARMGLDPATHRPVLLGSHLDGGLLLRRAAQPAEQSRHARPPLSLLDKSFVSHMAQWELARLEAEARLSASSSSSPRISPSPRSTLPTSLKPNSSGGITLSRDSCTSRRNIIDSTSSSSSPALLPVELCAEPATYGSCNVHLKAISDWCAPTVSDSAVSALLSFFDNCISASDQNCGSNTLKPRALQRAGDEDEPLQVESSAGRMSAEAFNLSGSCPAHADSGLRGARTPTTMAPLPSEDLQLDGPTAHHHDIPPYFEDIILSTSPDQPCLSGSTSLWTQYVLDYMGLAMLPPSCYAC